MANVLGTLFGDIAKAIRDKTGETDAVKMKPAEFPAKIAAIETGADYNLALAEMMMTRDAKKLFDDPTKLLMKSFVLSDGNTLGSMAEYAFAGFKDVEYMAFTGPMLIYANAFCGDTKLKLLDFTLHRNIDGLGFFANALNGCTALESIIIRDGGSGIKNVSFQSTSTIGSSDNFYVYVPSAYYDTVVGNIGSSGAVPTSRFRKLEDYPEIDNWNNPDYVAESTETTETTE